MHFHSILHCKMRLAHTKNTEKLSTLPVSIRIFKTHTTLMHFHKPMKQKCKYITNIQFQAGNNFYRLQGTATWSEVQFTSLAPGEEESLVISRYIRLKMYAFGYILDQYTSIPSLLHIYTHAHNT